MRRGFGWIGLVLTGILLAIVGVIAYQAGWSEGVATQVPAGAAAAPYYYYGYGPHFWGFGLFGLFWALLILFILFWVARRAFFGRMFWGGGWGYGRGMGHHGYGAVPLGIEERLQEWHKRAHGEQPPGSTPPPPPPDQRTV
ncbi:hypothetical protein EPN29_00055 [bacterium]|nr:MAG: hypothetical protein EPN29_00055 [bacterium]